MDNRDNFRKHIGPKQTLVLLNIRNFLLKCCFNVAILPEQAVNGRGAAVDAPQHIAGFAAQVPAQGKGVKVGKEAHLNHAVSVLLHPDPQEGAHVTDKP